METPRRGPKEGEDDTSNTTTNPQQTTRKKKKVEEATDGCEMVKRFQKMTKRKAECGRNHNNNRVNNIKREEEEKKRMCRESHVENPLRTLRTLFER